MTEKNNKLTIRNSTAEFLMFTPDSRQDGIEVRFEDKTVWLSQKMMAVLFDVSVPTVNESRRLGRAKRNPTNQIEITPMLGFTSRLNPTFYEDQCQVPC